MQLPLLGAVGHDSLQYTFVADDGRIFTARIFQTASLEIHWAWIFDDGQAWTALDDNHRSVQDDGSPSLSVRSPNFAILTDESGGGHIEVDGDGNANTFAVKFEVGNEVHASLEMFGKREVAFYQPDLNSEITYRGDTLRAQGFCKRYSWPKIPRYWGYRYFTGYADDGSLAIWAADAMFGVDKYDYFRVLDADGKLVIGEPERSCHKTHLIRSELDGARYEVRLMPLAAAERFLRSDAMDSHLRQEAVRFEADLAGTSASGIAVYEYVYGTLG